MASARKENEPYEQYWSSVDFNNSQGDTSHTKRQVCYAVVAASEGDLESMKICKGEGVDLNLGDYDNRTPLHLACANGHMNVVRFLIDQCNVNVHAKDRWDNTPLMQAKESHQQEVVDILVEHMQNKKLIVDAILASHNGDLALLKSLAEGGLDMNASNPDGRTPLHLACAEGHASIVRYLLFERNVNARIRDRWNRTPLQQAIQARHTHIVALFRELLETRFPESASEFQLLY